MSYEDFEDSCFAVRDEAFRTCCSFVRCRIFEKPPRRTHSFNAAIQIPHPHPPIPTNHLHLTHQSCIISCIDPSPIHLTQALHRCSRSCVKRRFGRRTARVRTCHPQRRNALQGKCTRQRPHILARGISARKLKLPWHYTKRVGGSWCRVELTGLRGALRVAAVPDVARESCIPGWWVNWWEGTRCGESLCWCGSLLRLLNLSLLLVANSSLRASHCYLG